MKLSLYGALCASLLLAGTGCNSKPDAVETAQETNEAKHEAATPDNDMGKVEEKKMDFDTEFLTKAASGGMLEVELGKAVAAHAVSSEAKKFAGMMVMDHSKSNQELMAIAAKKNITLPTTLGEDHQTVYDDVTKKTGINMDKEYLKEMVEDHQEDVKEFTEASVKASDAEIKAFATKNVPILQHHLEESQKMLAALKDRK